MLALKLGQAIEDSLSTRLLDSMTSHSQTGEVGTSLFVSYFHENLFPFLAKQRKLKQNLAFSKHSNLWNFREKLASTQVANHKDEVRKSEDL